jgi:hypothetical protein
MAEIRLDLEEANGALPDMCACCGEPSAVIKTRNMSWFPPWVSFLILAGWLPYLILVLVLTKRATVQVPLCEQHQGHWFNRYLLTWVSFLIMLMVAIGMVAAAASLQPRGREEFVGFAALGALLLFILWIVMVIVVWNTVICPKEITDHEIVLQGVSEAFVDAVEEGRDHWGRRGRRAPREDYEDEDDMPRPRKKAAPSDAIQEERRRRVAEDDNEPRSRRKRPSDEFEE